MDRLHDNKQTEQSMISFTLAKQQLPELNTERQNMMCLIINVWRVQTHILMKMIKTAVRHICGANGTKCNCKKSLIDGLLENY